MLSRDVPYSLWPTGGSLVPPSMQLRCSFLSLHTPNTEVRLPCSYGAKIKTTPDLYTRMTDSVYNICQGTPPISLDQVMLQILVKTNKQKIVIRKAG